MGFYPYGIAGTAPVTTLVPSGDTTGAKDSAAIAAAATTGTHLLLASGNWYLSGATISNNSVFLQGSGAGTIINAVAGDTAFTISGVTRLEMSDMLLSLGSGSLGIQVNGAEDAHFHDLWFTGSSAAGGVSVNGDDLTEQSWTDIWMRGVGGTNFAYTRTTTADEGGMYLARVRLGGAPSTATGFSFTSTAGSPSPVFAYFVNCSADGFGADAWYFSNVLNVQIDNIWGTMAVGTTGYPLHIAGGGNVRVLGGYLYQSATASKIVYFTGGTAPVYFSGFVIFDGAATGYALGLVTSTGGVYIGDYISFAGTISDAMYVLSFGMPSRTPTTFLTQNSAADSLGIDMAGSTGQQMWLYNASGTLTFENTAFTLAAATLTQTGILAAGGGTDTSAFAAASSPTFVSGTAKQCSTTQDVMLYIAIQTAAALAVAIGPTSGVADAIMPSQTYALGMISLRIPKGWYVKITGTVADLTITQVTC